MKAKVTESHLPLAASLVTLAFAISFGIALPVCAQPNSQPAQTNDGSTPLRPALNPDGSRPPDPTPINKLDNIVQQAEESEGAIFVDENKVHVKAPLLTALIELRREQSPYGIDALGARPITLREVLQQELNNNLDIKISNANMQSSLWQFRSTLGNFLPNIGNQFSYQSLSGFYASPFGLLSPISTTNMNIPSQLSWTPFNGGANLYGAIQARHLYKAAQSDLARTTNDFLYEGAHLYYQLVLQDVLLQIRIKAVETSQALVEKNTVQYQYGANTQLDLLQAQTQLANDRQELISQQVARRKAAVLLATNLNLPGNDDLTLSERYLTPKSLVDDNAKVQDLVQIAIDNRPELKKWEQQRLAAKAAIKVAFAPLLPSVTGSAGLATTGAKVQSTSSNNSASAASSAGTGGFATGSFSSTSTVASTGGSSNNKRTFDLAEIYLIGVSVQWNIGGMGYTEVAKVQAAKWEARKAQLEFARELTWVCKSVRDAYLDSTDAQNLISATTAAVNSSRQQLKVATIRLEEGVGTDLDVVNAQRDYTNALIKKAKAIVQFNEAQVQLMRATGRMSVDALVGR